MKVYEFRKDLKQAFDAALRGEEVSIERGSVNYTLTADIVVANRALREAKVPAEDRFVQTPEGIQGPTKLEPKSIKFCKNGHPIPAGRDKCLGKGCKYS